MTSTLQKLNEIFIDVFDDDGMAVTAETTARDVDAWDSLMHVTLMLNVEREFKIRFTSAEIASLKNVSELTALVEGHLVQEQAA